MNRHYPIVQRLGAKCPKRCRLIAWLVLCALLTSACDPAPEIPPAPVPDQNERPTLRLATFNVAMGMSSEGELAQALQQPNHPRLRQLAEILQRVRPDILLLNEFDYDSAVDAAALLNDNYLGQSQNGQDPIHFAYQFRAPVNTGIDSALDLDGNGENGEPGDAWGFGRYPGQYGMLVLSRFAVNVERSRSFQQFRWANLPEARKPANPDGSNFYPDNIWPQLRLSSKSHWDVLIDTNGRRLHLLAFHPTPPVFDGQEDRNGLRNFDEIRFWVNYLAPEPALYLIDDQGRSGGLAPYQPFVIAGDFNADPLDGDSVTGAAAQLLDHPRINHDCTAASEGGRKAAELQAGVNQLQHGDPASDTSDFNDDSTGNLRLDYLLPSRELTVTGCGVFWPAPDQPGHDLIEVSDHRLVWLDIEL
jgi:endonuclease/exonuclease/phosphatase family metal-dependent hydrolase